MYKLLIRPLFFLFDPESIHHFAFSALKFFYKIPGVPFLLHSLYHKKDERLEREVFGIKFPNPVGLAAGFDKDARLVDELGNFGFGFIEIGTLTPVGQPGNEKPRLFRLPKDKAIINRMGFNNEGVSTAVERLKKKNSNVIVGGNIGKNKVTPNKEAVDDYIASFKALFPYVDYFVVNVSSPNTPNLRELQEKEPLLELLSEVQHVNYHMENAKPLLLKIAPDLSDHQLDDIVDIVKTVKLDGIIATNTTISRMNLKTADSKVDAIGAGGLSGRPLKDRSTEVITYLNNKLDNKVPIIAVGGIFNGQDAIEKLKAGASLVQVYTGFVYEGPSIIKKINKQIIRENL
ncbi:quinone-dependent dihydroorotate dehydrogenase [Mangrovivirga cuniculi]|uniref:Dihydroorotate dehydrogenase (quinone) n=1 Tax=Mangrovivirga cuniculi TaxID=2715131 RepID=A0A4D7JQL9_9BACT|nr:quinone-dependent dihydroorotate dehydrogenase [Mangrovivirga cuniculi]QCK17033.1 dihydroorotate dehydrogenase (quinone) [Mangrovivirga cuniculi]